MDNGNDLDKKLEDLSSSKVMGLNGWLIDAPYENNPKYYRQCGTNGWFGYKYGYPVGSIKATFRGEFGVASLSFGNCYSKGQVIVYLNKKEISRAEGNVSNKDVVFNFTKGDTLSIKEKNVAIIKLNELRILR